MKKINIFNIKERFSWTVFLGVFIALVFLLWIGHHIVTGQTDLKVYVFPTVVEGVGWENKEALAEQTLSGQALLSDFNEENSSYIIIGEIPFLYDQTGAVEDISEQDAVLREESSIDEKSDSDSSDMIDAVEQDIEPETDGESEEPFGLSVGDETEDVPLSTVRLSEEENGVQGEDSFDDTAETNVIGSEVTTEETLSDDVSQETLDEGLTDMSTEDTPEEIVENEEAETPTSETSDADAEPSAFLNGNNIAGFQRSPKTKNVFFDIFSKMSDSFIPQAFAQEGEGMIPEDDDINLDTGLDEDMFSAEISDTGGVGNTTPFFCEIQEKECYTLELSGFRLNEVPEASEIKHIELRLSFASLIHNDDLFNDRLFVKYLYEDQWFIAGEIFLDREISNIKNGGYLAFPLPEFRSWQSLDDLQVMLEYDRDNDSPTEIYLDSVWLDVTYKNNKQENFSSDGNIKNELNALDESLMKDILAVSEEKKIIFDYTDENSDETFIIKTEHGSYDGLSDTEIYFNITNTSGSDEYFDIRFFFPEDTYAKLNALRQWTYNVPYEKNIPEYGDMAYLCTGGWKVATDTVAATGEYYCDDEPQMRACNSFNDDKTNCIVKDEQIGSHTEIEYKNEFIDIGFITEEEYPQEIINSLTEYESKKPVDSFFDLRQITNEHHLVGAGQTLYFVIDLARSENPFGDLYIEAIGEDSGYGLVGPHKNNVPVEREIQKEEKAIDAISDNVLFKKDLLITDKLAFKFKYNSQKGFLDKLFESSSDEKQFMIKKLTMIDPGGEEVMLPIGDIEYGDSDEWSFVLSERHTTLRPGKYFLKIEIEEDNQLYFEEKEFYWGVLAINTNKSVYFPEETAFIQMGVLSDNGNTICNANLRLMVTDPFDNTSVLPVQMSGQCSGNNVTDMPDYFVYFDTTATGTYRMELVHFDADGSVLHDITDSFEVWDEVPFDVERVGPTRIYPPSPYTMQMNIIAKQDISGTIVEILPEGFIVEDTNADSIVSDEQGVVLTWNVEMLSEDTLDIHYIFDAPDLSPYLYTVGPLQFTDSTSTVAFEELRQWQIASDATGNMLVFWEGTTMPSGWSCVSCSSGDDFYQSFIVGSSTYGTTGGTTTHTHTVSSSLYTSSSASAENRVGTTISNVSHTHTFTPIISTVSNLPEYRQLKVIRYDTAGEPPQLPTGAILVFDNTAPSGWTRISAQDDYYVRGENTVGTTGGSNDHTHTITGTTGAATGGTNGNRGGGTASAATAGHTHTVSTSTSPNVSNEPPYIEVIFASLDATSTPPNDIISMWSDTPATGWLSVSDSGDDFADKFIKGASSYGSTGGTSTHSHADVTGISTAQTGTILIVRSGPTGASAAHQHTIDVTNFSTEDNYPPYIEVIFAKRQGLGIPAFTQNYYRWYTNTNSQTPTDPWPSGAANLNENEKITATSTPVKPGDMLRLRMSVGVTNATTTATSTAFRLQYGEGPDCSTVSSWNDVGQIASSTIWRGYNNTSVADGSDLSSTTLSITDVAQSYEEENNSTSTPNVINVGQEAEWDWVVYDNGATGSTNYCFRMVEGNGKVFNSYTRYPQVITNNEPNSPTLVKLFDNEKVASTTPWFDFYATDNESDKVHYQIQVDDDKGFGSTIIDKDTISNSSQFENTIVPADKAPYIQNNNIRFTPTTVLANNTTYWWRVRAKDPDGSNSWGTWSAERSFTIDTSVSLSTWFQTMQEQFDADTLSGTRSLVTDEVDLITGSTTGSIAGSMIDFDWKTSGTIWGAMSWNDTEAVGDIKYHVEYFTSTSSWATIPDSVLSGNGVGFDTSPVGLESVDTNTYNQIRIKADLTDSGGSPSLQDWTIVWGTRVETPTLTKLFDNEKTSTTTPAFEFYTADPQGDNITYQFSWSTNYDFTSSTTKISDTDAGFSNVTTGADTDPFNSGDTISFKVQSGDSLTNDTTYWWRVRAKDPPPGGDSWSLWSEKRSLTVATSTVVSTWFQTTGSQFDTNTLSGIQSLGDQATVATSTGDAMIAYGEGTVQTPKYRTWNGSSWSAESSALSVGAQINWIVLRAGVTRDEYLLGTVGTDNDVNVQVYSNDSWGDLQEMTAALSNSNARGFDIAYEMSSGDALVVYCDGDADPSYRVWNGSSWGSEGSINLSSTNNCDWIKLASDPVSDEIIVVSLDSNTGTAYEAQVWNGSSWGNSTTQGSMSEAGHEGMAIEYEESGGQAMLITSDGNGNRFRYNTWNGSSWGTVATQSLGDDMEWGTLKRDDGLDALTLCYVDHDNDIGTVRWTGSAWTAYNELDTSGNSKTDRPIDCEYEVSTGRDGYIMAAYSDTTNVRYSYYNGGSWSAEASISTITDSSTIQLRRTGDGTILGIFFDDVNTQYDFSSWNGTSWSTVQTLETEPSVTGTPYKEPFMIAPQNPQTTGTLISNTIDFDDGSGPYWDKMSWSDTESGGSTLLYQVQYYNTASSSWDLVPNSYIPGNSTGTSTSPIDLTNLSITTHNQLRLVASFTCSGSDCPYLQNCTVQWAEGITISGTAKQYDQTSNVAAGTVAVAVNGSLQSGKTGTIAAGIWNIPNVTTFSGDIITVFINGAGDANEAVGVAKYDGTLDISGIELYERHLSIGSDDDQIITNADLAFYDNSVSGNEDIFHDVDGSNDIDACDPALSGCSDVEIFIKEDNTYRPDSGSSGDVTTHDIETNGEFIIDGNTINISGSWDNNGGFDDGAGAVVFVATSTTESIDSTGAATSTFNNVTFGQTSGSATWGLTTDLDVDGNFNVDHGSVSPSTSTVDIAGDLTIGVNGGWIKGAATTTLDGSGTHTWTDNTAAKQDIGIVVIDGTAETIQLGSSVKATDIIIGGDDTFNVTSNNYSVEIGGNWTNNNIFSAHSGEVSFTATSSGRTITAGVSSFHDLTFNGSGGGWTFQDTSATIGNDLLITNGSVTLPTATTTIGGSLDNNDTFSHAIGTILFSSANIGETVDPGSSTFFNVVFDNAAGGWTVSNNATTTNDLDLTNAASFMVSSGMMVEVKGEFTNALDGDNTEWDGSTLFLNSGTNYSINIKTATEDRYDVLQIGANTDIKMWNTSATTTTIDSIGSLYSQDHDAVYGDLYIWGDYVRSSGTEYWSYATDFDGTDISGSPRQVDVRLANEATTTINGGATLAIIGSTAASTSIDSQSGTYSVVVADSTINAQYYEFRYLNTNGLQLTGSTSVTTLSNGDFELASLSDGGTMMTIASTTIDANPLLQIFNVRFATSTGVTSGFNVTQSGGASASYWWFRDHSGNYDGEAFDNDTGNPGTIRWDDSNLTITVAGVVYSDDGSTAMGGPTCDGATQVVRLLVDGLGSYTSSCNAGTGAYSIPAVTYNGDVVITVFLDNAPGSERGTMVTRTPTTNILDAHIYANRTIVRHEDTSAITIENMSIYDSSDDNDIAFTAITGSTDTLTTDSETELYIWDAKTFAPGGNITLNSGGSGASYDGSIHADDNSIFIVTGTSSHSVGGSWVFDTGSSFTAASSTVTFTATTTSKIITAQSSFYDVVFTGSGGGWGISGNATVANDVDLSAGTVSGNGNLTVQGGDITGNGTFDMDGGAVTLDGTGDFGGVSSWTFNDLTFGDGAGIATTTKVGTGGVNVKNALEIAGNQILIADGSIWNLSGGGTPFVITGSFDSATSTFQYTATSSAVVTATDYYELDLMANGSGSPTYTIAMGTLSVAENLDIGDGVNNVTVTADTNDPTTDIEGNVVISQNATLSGSNSGSFSVGGSWTNNGTFSHGNGTVTFDSLDTGEIVTTGGSSFHNVIFNNIAGGWTISDSATSTNNWNLANASSFTASSSVTVEVDGTFTNAVGGASTTWSGSTLFLNSGTDETINTKISGDDTYDTFKIGAGTNIRVWNSTSTVYTVDPSGSLYSQDHNASNGDLYIWGDYRRSSGADYWNWAIDFDGTDLSGGLQRQVDVFLASNATTTIIGGSLHIVGTSSATTTIDRQGNGTYSVTIDGGNINAQYYKFRNMNDTGLQLLGSSAVSELSNGDFELSANAGSMITVAGTVINANPLETFSGMKFATSTGITSGYNFDVTSGSVSSWRITSHFGNYDGEDHDNDPGGDPGYIVWDDSAADIIISGNVYSDEDGTVSGVCDGSTQVVRLMVEGGGNRITSCSAVDGSFSISGVFYIPGDVLTLYLDNASGGEQAVNVTVDPFTNISSMHLYEDRVIVRHEDSDPITISDMSVYDSDQDPDIPFDADTGAPHTLVLPADKKLIIWDNKTFVPAGNVTLNSGGTGNAWDGALAIRDGATFSAAGTQSHSIGGSWTASSTATYVPANTTVTFTATTSGKTIRTSGSNFYNAAFNGSGGAWTLLDTSATIANNLTITAGSTTLPTATTTIGGSFNNNGGTFTHNSGVIEFTSTSAGETIVASSSDFSSLKFSGAGGTWTIQDTNATSTNDIEISAGAVTLPSEIFTVGGSFDNTGGSFTHSSGTIKFTSTSASGTIEANDSDFGSLVFNGAGGEWTFQDVNATTTGDVTIQAGDVTFPTGVSSFGGSFTNNGSFSHAIGTMKFVSDATGKTVNVGTSTVFNVIFDNSTGGWTVSGSATSTNDWNIIDANSYTVSSGSTIEIQGEFSNSVDGASTTWDGTTLYLNSASAYDLNIKTQGGDQYDTLSLGADTDIRMWNSAATTTTVASSSSLYSQDHSASDGDLYIWGDYSRVSGLDYWSYATDFDGANLSGSERQVNVRLANDATTTITGGALMIVGNSSLPTTINNQSSGTYALVISGGTFNATHYQFRNMNTDGLKFTGTPTITSLDSGDFELAVNGGSMITVASTTIDQNPAKTNSSVVFATSTGITSGYNVELVGSTTNAWTFTGHSGNYDGEAHDLDGADACGQIRWNDSVCLFVNQTHYRWRNDDGGEGVPSSQWYNGDWDKRKRIRVTENSSSALADFQLKIVVNHDSDMQNNFGDLRFTDSSGTTSLDYWIENYVSGASSTIWVKVPSIPSDGTSDIYVYYDNVGTVTTTGVATSTFIFFDDFEDNDITEYSGDTSLFDADASFNYEGTYGIGASTGNEDQKTTDGIYRTGSDNTVSQGETIKFFQYIDMTSGASDEPCALFGVQTPGSGNNNYAVCLDPYNTDQIVIAKDVSSNDSSGTQLATKDVTFSTGWYGVEIDWLTSDDIDVTVYNSSGSVLATTTATSSSYTSGGIGFSFWSQHGGWDYYTSRKYASSEPTYAIYEEQVDDGASWKTAEDTTLTNQLAGENVRLRFTVQNTGSDIQDQNFRLQYVDRGAYANCLAVPYGNYNDIPTTNGGCGTAPACMTVSSQFANRASTTQLLSIPNGADFTEGQIIEDPSNDTGDVDVLQDYVTEVEYNFQLTAYATGSSYCFRTTDSGSSLDNYATIAEVIILHAPNITTFSLNSEQNISLTEGTTESVSATGTVTDANGYGNLSFATSTFYRSLATSSFMCADDPNNCYQIASTSCSFSNCSGNICGFECIADMQYFADPTDAGEYSGQSWLAQVSIVDKDGNRDSSGTIGVHVMTLYALGVVENINYGTLNVGSTTESTNATTTVQNTGNSNIDVKLDGTDLDSGDGSIPVNKQKYATSTFTYSSCAICSLLSGTSTPYEIDLPKPTSTTTQITDKIYWGIAIPDDTAGLTHYGTNTFFATSD